MDRIIKVTQEHQEYANILSVIEKSLETNTRDAAPYVKRLKDFIDEYLLVHFEFEENRLFSVILKIGTQEEKDLIKELKKEHVQILDEITQFNDVFSSNGYQSGESAQIKEIHWYSKKIIYMVIQHARKEDNEFLPILKRYQNHFN